MKITDIFVVVCLRVLTKHKNSVCVCTEVCIQGSETEYPGAYEGPSADRGPEQTTHPCSQCG